MTTREIGDDSLSIILIGLFINVRAIPARLCRARRLKGVVIQLVVRSIDSSG